MTFIHKLQKAQDFNNSFLCVGIDPLVDQIPKKFRTDTDGLFEFGKWIVDQTKDFVSCYKPNSAFYESIGGKGLDQLQKLCNYIHSQTSIPIILDAKRGDIGHTADAYTKYIFEFLGVDAVTINPYMGKDSAQPFLDYSDKGIILLARTSNPSASEFMDVLTAEKIPMWQLVVRTIVSEWNERGNCLLVMGATSPEQLVSCRHIAPDMTYLIPGVGSQGGDLKKTIQAGLNREGRGVIINASRSIIYAPDPGQAAMDLRDAINSYRSQQPN